jgi:hypothetical protein
MEAELREEEMVQEEEKEVHMAVVEVTTVAVQAVAVQQQQQSQPPSHPQAVTVAAAAAEAPDEKAGVERTVSVGKRAKECDEEVTSTSGEDEAKLVQYAEKEVDAKRRKLSVAQKRRARKKAGKREAEEDGARDAVDPIAALQAQAVTLSRREWSERWAVFAPAHGLPRTGEVIVDFEDGSLTVSAATGLPIASDRFSISTCPSPCPSTQLGH